MRAVLRNWFKRKIFKLKGQKPWSYGYINYKVHTIKSILKKDDFNSNKLPDNYGFRIDERVIEYPWLFSKLSEKEGNLLDAGSILNFKYIIAREKLQNKNIFISTLAPEGRAFWQNKVSYVYEDLRNTCYRDAYFDWVVSLSTIEHIGLDNTKLYTDDSSKAESSPDGYLKAIQEYHRVLKPGGICYLSVPYGKKSVKEWYQVFDAQMIEDIISVFKPTSYNTNYYQYLSSGWVVSNQETAKEATYFDIHEKKQYDTDYAAASRAVVCLELIK
ncbi:MAG: class I SAM-dependent methyltransferase [Leptospirales bacterium]